jgi:23S rRNA pseudouridine1911/1915/1917 synthase
MLDGQPVRARSALLRTGQRLQAVVQGTPQDLPVADSSVAFEVVYEDDDIVVVDKPAGLVVHHGAGQRAGTLVDGLLARFPDIGKLGEPSEVGEPPEVFEPSAGEDDSGRPGIVHRLDKGTSGLLVVARSRRARASLAEQFRVHSAERRYLALVAGTVEADRGQVDAPIGRSTRRPDRMAVTPSGRPARTSYAVRQRYDSPLAATMVEATLDTGRTHQVRVHLAAVGHPVIGDDRYGGARARPAVLLASLGQDRLFLHAGSATSRPCLPSWRRP